MTLRPLLLALCLPLAACSWGIKLDSGGNKVRTAWNGDVAGCRDVGKVTVSVLDHVGPMDRNGIKVRDELEVMARNEAASLGADTIKPLGDPRDGEQGWAAFHIEKPHRPAESEPQLERIEQMKHRYVVLAEAQVLKAASQQLGLDEQVGDDHDQRPLPDRFRQLVQHRHELSLPFRARVLQNVEHRQEMRRTPLRRHMTNDAVRHAGEAHGVTLLQRQMPQRSGDPAGVFDLGGGFSTAVAVAALI